MSEEEPEETEETEEYQITPEEATNTGANVVNLSAVVKRKDVMMLIGIGFAVVVMAGLVFSGLKTKKQNAAEDTAANAARTPLDFLRRERDSVRQDARSQGEAPGGQGDGGGPEDASEGAASPARGRLPEVTVSRESPAPAAPPPPPQNQGGGGGSSPPPFTAHRAPMVPPLIEGSLFAKAAAAPEAQDAGSRYAANPYAQTPPANPYAQGPQANPAAAQKPSAGYSAPADDGGYAAQNDRGGKQNFYDGAASGAEGSIASGRFIGGNALWIGTIVPAVLESAVNTDLPGAVIARVSENVYDSQTGTNLLIPQGTLLTARYNSSVSYAQHRIQIAWDTLTRPDGYHVELGGMSGVDERGMSGAGAAYHENWFEYLKAAGIIAMFSVANSKMASDAASYAGQETAASVVQANADLMNQLGGSMTGRAMNIQPTLTLEAGEPVNVMINRNLYLPPAQNYPVTQKYTLK